MPERVEEEHKHTSLFQKVDEYMSMCESDMASKQHWHYLKCLYKKLVDKKKLKPEFRKLLKKLEEFVMKHRNYDSGEGYLDLDGMSLFSYDEDEDS